MGRFRSTTFVRVGALTASLVIVAAACGGGGDGDDSGSGILGGNESSSSSTSSTTRAGGSTDSEVPAAFGDAPALVVGLRTPSENQTLKTEFPLPVGYISSPTARKATMIEQPPPGVLSSVSPNGDYAARVRKPTAVKKGAIEIYDVETGRKIEDAEYEGQSAGRTIEWATDGSGLAFLDEKSWYVHKIGGPTVAFDPAGGATPNITVIDGDFTSDGDAVAVVSCSRSQLIRLSSADTDRAPDQFGSDTQSSCKSAPVLDEDGTPVVVASLGVDVIVVDPTGSPRTIASTGASPSYGLSPTTCDGLVVLSSSIRIGSNEHPYFVFDVASETVVPFPGGIVLANGTCPIPSPDRSKFAIATNEGPVLVFDVATAESVEVSRTGDPISWNMDSDELLVNANGLFVVAADGSGGDQVTDELATSMPVTGGLYCRAGDSGVAILRTGTEVIVYDVGKDKATATNTNQLASTCSTTPDDRWLVSGTLIVDLESGKSATLPDVNTETGLRNGQFPVMNGHRWHGNQTTLSASASNRASN